MMKRSVLFFSVSLLVFSSNAQYTLQYNQVKMVGTTEETVPAGKVWKVESAMINKKDGNTVTPSFRIVRSGVADTVYLGLDSYNISSWYDVLTFDVYIRKGVNFSCSYNNTLNLRILGSGGGNFIDQTFSYNYNANSLTTSFPASPNISFAPSSPGNNSIDKWQFFTTMNFDAYEYRLVVNLRNGTKLSYMFNYSITAGNCYSNWGAVSWHIGSSSTPPVDIPRIDITRPTVTTAFPFWLSAGTSLKALKNIACLSIIEFNETAP